MKEIIQSKYARFFIAALALTIICAWFSAGFHHADEHFQVFEFCSYKMGYTYASAMPWEFHQKMRASLLPGIAFWGAEAMEWCGLYNPFTLAFLLRLFTGIASWFIVCRFCLLLSSKFKTPRGEKLFILMSLFLWFIPYLNVRFTFENIAGILILYGIYAILRNDEKAINTIGRYILAGLLFGISFFIRFQTVFAIAGFIAWLIFIRKTRWNYIFVLSISMATGIGINILIDHWFYGEWTFTPFNYYYANIIQHKAADFGVSPWWFYFSDFIIRAVPPLSLLLLIMFFAGVLKNRKDPMVWVIVPFVVAHLFIRHKEIRFLFPVTFIFIYITALGFDYFLAKTYYQKIHRYVFVVSLIICIPLLIFRIVVPAQASVSYYKFIYDYVPERNTVFFVLAKDDYYNTYELHVNFYKKPGFTTVPVEDISQMDKYLQTNHPKSALFLSKRVITSMEDIKGYKAKIAYCFFPSRILKYDINKWEERTQIWCIYEFDKIE